MGIVYLDQPANLHIAVQETSLELQSFSQASPVNSLGLQNRSRRLFMSVTMGQKRL